MEFVLGVDEAGRGPLAGPVAVGLVAVPEGFDVAREFPGVADSKQLSEKKREELYGMLETRVALGDARFIVEFGSPEKIDRQGIAVVVREAVARGVGKLAKRGHQVSECLLTPGVRVPGVRILLDGALKAPLEFAQETIINGDELVPLISLASIAAKVERDRLMVALAKEYPAYGFEQHKGYGTRLHYEMLKQHGLCAIHRRTFTHLVFPEN